MPPAQLGSGHRAVRVSQGKLKPLEINRVKGCGLQSHPIGTYDSWTTLAEEREKEQNEGGKTV